jgi:hypothetical protein
VELARAPAAISVIDNLRLRAARPIGGTRVIPFAALNNMTNRRDNSSVVINAAGARYFEPAPGRNFFVGIALRAAGKQARPCGGLPQAGARLNI